MRHTTHFEGCDCIMDELKALRTRNVELEKEVQRLKAVNVDASKAAWDTIHGLQDRLAALEKFAEEVKPLFMAFLSEGAMEWYCQQFASRDETPRGATTGVVARFANHETRQRALVIWSRAKDFMSSPTWRAVFGGGG